MSKVAGVPIASIVRLSTWKSWEKLHLGVAPMVNKKEYYEGEGDDFFQIRAMVSLVSFCMPMVRLCTKIVLIMH
jgi:hypothetical protein